MPGKYAVRAPDAAAGSRTMRHRARAREQDDMKARRCYGDAVTTGGTTLAAAPRPADDARLAAAIAASRLCGLEPDLLARVLEGSRIRQDAAGALVRPIGEGGSHLELVLSGSSAPRSRRRTAGA